MNFFEHQNNARKQSRWIVFAFLGVTFLIIMAINAVVLMVAGTISEFDNTVNVTGIFTQENIKANSSILIIASLITGSVISVASLGKIASLRSGGGKVARDMGATIVTPSTKDPLRKRYYNVVEEIAIASGTPVPEVYVMENESGINAFVAGYTATDAAIAVTQGCLEKLNRNELQGVIAHEFSHILNGDMRINIRMMGIIFGILVIAIMGRKIISSIRYSSRSSRDKNGGAIVFIGIGLVIIGYIGLFFARWMKSALSRQREYLADASAVQFTRDPGGISGALKKIAAYNHSSYLHDDSEEISHMLFSSGINSFMFATHPPLEERISRLQKSYRKGDIEKLAKKLKQQEYREHVQAEIAEQEQTSKKEQQSKNFIDVDTLIDDIGNPNPERILAAAALASSMPSGLSNSAHSLEWAPEVLFYCLLDKKEAIRNQQLLIVVQQMGDISERKIQHLLLSYGLIETAQRLPILEMCFPTLKRRPIEDIEKIQTTIENLVSADQVIDSFEFLLTRLINQYLFEAHIPNRTRLHGNKRISKCSKEVSIVMSILAQHGYDTQSNDKKPLIEKAYNKGMATLGLSNAEWEKNSNWQDDLDQSLLTLDKLKASEKSKLIAGLVACMMDDTEVVTSEHEMFRVMCALIHVPIPMINKLSV